MSKDKEKDKKELLEKGIDRREFLKRSAIGAGTVAATIVMGGCGSSSSSSGSVSAGAAGVPTAQAFKFGIMADLQWIAPDDGYNPNTSAISLARAVQRQFISQGVKFVVDLGDLADAGSTKVTTAVTEAGYSILPPISEDTRALFAQDLYNAGIGLFPLRGNHDDTVAAEFLKVYPQTQTGVMNSPSTYSYLTGLSGVNPDSKTQTTPLQTNSSIFTQGANFSSPTASTLNQTGYTGSLAGLTYSFDYNNARFVIIDQFTPPDSKGPDGNAYSLTTTAALQQPWITQVLSASNRPAHAFVFSHKGVIGQKNMDCLFGATPTNAGSPGAEPFIKSMYNNNAHFYFCGHDHMHNRSIVQTVDGTANVTHILCAADSSKLFIPNEDDTTSAVLTNAPCTSTNWYYFGQYGQNRQIQLNQEIYTVGYYIVTVDGVNATVDFYSAPVYPTYDPASGYDSTITTTPTLNFTKRETFGYSLKGQQFLVTSGSPYTTVSNTSPYSGTIAKILNGINGIQTRSLSPTDPVYSVSVNTGWYTAMSNTSSDILALWGMAYTLGSNQTDTFVLQMSFNPGSLAASQLTSGGFGIASPDANGNWTNTVNNNFNGGSKNFVAGPWNSSYTTPGTYGVDATNNNAWAVINHNGTNTAPYNGYFAVVNGI